jgi:hypothetical protein
MSSIERNQELLFENVFSCRLAATQCEIRKELERIPDLLRRAGVRRSGPVVTTTSSLNIFRGRPILDFEILFPLDGKMTSTGCYEIKPLFHLVNALRLRHDGGRDTLPRSYDELVVYMISEELQPITPLYSVVSPQGEALVDDVGPVEVYVGIDPSEPFRA